MVILAKRYGIVTPYTSYLVTQDVPMSGAPTAMKGKFDRYRASGYGGAKLVEESADMEELQNSNSTWEMDKAAEKKSKNAYRIMRTVGTKTFYFSHGTWKDADYNEKKDKEIQKIKLASDDYMELIKKEPGIVRFLSLGKVIVSFKGTIYQITG